jgi:hypothetical protein
MTFRRFSSVAMCTASLFIAPPAFAQLSLALTPNAEMTAGGVPAVYSAQLDNQAPTGNLFLNGISFDFRGDAAKFLVANDSQFALVPNFLTPAGTSGSRYSGPLFSIRPYFQTPPGTYSGAVTVLGGATAAELFPLRTVTFTLITTQGFGRDAPEPPTGGYWVLGVGCWAFYIRRRVFKTIP